MHKQSAFEMQRARARLQKAAYAGDESASDALKEKDVAELRWNAWYEAVEDIDVAATGTSSVAHDNAMMH